MKIKKLKFILIIYSVFTFSYLNAQERDKIFLEENGCVSVEAEHFYKQTQNQHREWVVIDSDQYKYADQDGDKGEYATACAATFIELLPDTRRTHADKLVKGENFSGTPGIAVVEYQIYFNTPGKYYVWVRAFSTGTEDNGIHVGLDGEWPESGKRMQWCKGKNEWTWESKQRTKEHHCGEAEKIFLEIKEKGVHSIQFSMREDGFAFDKFQLSTSYEKPLNFGIDEKIYSSNPN
ncbi:hypothetical protein [Sediminitomix flava]|uniref:Gylcosyl hydrolase 115 C-terminal domain-containing protein n=1 Tax=Sediminitomix flava TaxID=379075 RepID=A0A315Z4Z6_SEDFL|nr:hypothetical protein [Sediminitomix flava]PWJ37885.1 hypothetical protein BC781_10820 [Sediminitomix flava]